MSKLKIIVLIVIIIFLGIGSLSIYGWYKYYSFGFKAGMLPIQFYGKVVDQHGVKVTNAKVPFCLSGALLASGKGCGATFTDADGRFSIKSEGGGLTLYMMTHPDIDFQFPKPNYGGLHSARTLQMNFYGYQRTKSSNDPLWTDSSIDKPYIFTAWRQDKYENVKVGSILGFVKPNGSIFTYDFNKNSLERVLSGKQNGHLWVTCARGSIPNQTEKADWKVTITPINGGIQATEDNYLNFAPESGYQPSLVIEMKEDSLEYRYILKNKRYFFTALNGQVYGSLYVFIKPFIDNDSCKVQISQFKINQNGSRNLAVKRKL